MRRDGKRVLRKLVNGVTLHVKWRSKKNRARERGLILALLNPR
jgi:hypothetical protein